MAKNGTPGELDIRGLLIFLLDGLIREPDQVKITEEKDGDRLRYKVLVAKEDRGRVIGKGGRTADAVRAVMNAAATRSRQRISVEFID